MKKLKIELVEDAVCSWCPIGYFNLKNALSAVAGEAEVEVQLLPFELNPTMAPEGERIIPHLSRKYGMTEDQILATRKNLIGLGAAAGVNFDFSKRTHYYNTFQAHCLVQWAAEQGRHLELHEALIRAYFTEGIDIGSREQLLALCARRGFDVEAAAHALDSDELKARVRQLEARVARVGITSVPSLLVNGRLIAAGAQSVETLIELLRKSAA